jgi:hypothetical protein
MPIKASVKGVSGEGRPLTETVMFMKILAVPGDPGGKLRVHLPEALARARLPRLSA